MNEDTQLQTLPIQAVARYTPNADLYDIGYFDQTARIAEVMANGTLLPEHFWKDREGTFSPEQVKANCFAICNQARQWGLNPFSVIQATYIVKGRLGFEGKLVAGVVNSLANLKQRLIYTYEGSGLDLTVTVSGTFQGEDEPRTVTLKVKDAMTDNQMWKKDPEQKLCYSGATKWARRHCPEIILGVSTDDDLAKFESEPTDPAMAKWEQDKKDIEAYNARLLAQGETIIEPLPEKPEPIKAKVETAPIPWQDVKCHWPEARKGKKVSELTLDDMTKMIASIDKKSDAQRKVLALDPLLTALIDGLKAQTRGPLPQEPNAFPVQEKEVGIKPEVIKESLTTETTVQTPHETLAANMTQDKISEEKVLAFLKVERKLVCADCSDIPSKTVTALNSAWPEVVAKIAKL